MRFGFALPPFVLAATLGGGAGAQEWYTGANGGMAQGSGDSGPRASIDFSLSGTTQKAESAAAIGTIAPFAPMSESGARLRLGGVLGAYSYVSTAAGVGHVDGKQEDGSFLVGYEWVGKSTSIDAYVGADVANNSLTPFDPSNSVSGVKAGFKAAVDFYTNPTSFTMASGNASYSTADNGYYGRFKVGLSIAGGVFAGPEALFLGDDHFKQYRLGLHLSGLRFGALQFGVSGGLVVDKSQGNGAYGILDARVVF